ncbi:uncharacterized protein At1g01500-like [Rutidosis leptorrhynchoides]|uniref:uncharacterized protein At1g01500-like n=1 Tax=Rutidosis leptorrhynchoides TaxID=125765 RepID=UPI003A99FDE8
MDKYLYETVKKKEHKVINHGLQIIKHPSYQAYGKHLLSWFDVRVFYVRISNFMVDCYTPEYLTLNHIPLDHNTVLEVNGRRCALHSEGSSCRLKRNRVDKKFEEVTFVSTDSIRLSGSVKFEVFDKDDLILCGTLEISEKDDDISKWSMNCKSMICGSNGFLKGKKTAVCDSTPPMIEVYVAGSFSGTPIILTKALQSSFNKKQSRKGVLDSIPEYDPTEESQKKVAHGRDYQMAGYRSYKVDEDYDSSLFWSQTEYMEGEDGALSWFNAGVRVGVGIGLGVCLGVGVGVGLLVRTYQSTTRNFRRWL